MADLETTATEALMAIKALETEIQEADGRLNEMREGQIAAIDSQCDSIWERLEEQTSTFLEKAAAKKGLLEELGEGAVHDLAELREAVSAAYRQAEEEVEEARGEVAAFGDHIAAVEPEVAAMLETLQTSAKTLTDRITEVEGELQEAIQEAREFIGVEVVADLKKMEEEVEERAAALRKTILEDCQVPVEAKEIDWSAKLAEVVDTVEEAFDGAAEHAEKVAAYAIEECQRAYDEAFEELTKMEGTLEQAIEEFRGSIEDSGGEAAAAADSLEDGVQETIDALRSASSTLQDVLDLLAEFSFVVL